MELKINELKGRVIPKGNYRGEAITLFEVLDKNIYFTQGMDYTELIQENFFDNLEEAETFYLNHKGIND